MNQVVGQARDECNAGQRARTGRGVYPCSIPRFIGLHISPATGRLSAPRTAIHPSSHAPTGGLHRSSHLPPSATNIQYP